MFKRSGKRFLSVLLAVVVVLGSIPFVFQGTANAAYFSDGSKWVRTGSDYGKIKATLSNIDFKFMQTEDNQEFTFNQHLSLEKDAGEAYAHFNSITLYKGGTNTDSSLKVEEYPEKITVNGTQNMVDKMNLKYAWSASNDNARDVGVSGADIPSHDLRGTVVDLSDCPDYQWDCNLSFNAVHPENTPYGEIKTNYYWDFNWTYADVGLMGSRTTRQVRLCTDIIITDVRELKNKVEEFKSQIENYENGNTNGLTENRYLKLKKYVNAVPNNMIDGSKFYSQIDVDAMYDYITESATGLADYSAYYAIRSRVAEITRKNESGYIYGAGYTTESLDTLATSFTEIDEGLDKNLLLFQQDVVDEATANLKNALNGLVAVSFYEQNMSSISKGGDVWDLANDKLSSNWEDAELDVHIIGTKYMYMQTYDDQQFNLYHWVFMRSQLPPPIWTEKHPVLEYFVFDTTGICGDGICCDASGSVTNNSQEFVSRLADENKIETSNGVGYADWEFVTHENRYYNDKTEKITNATALCNNNGVIDQIEIGENGAWGRNSYLADADILFKGEGEGVRSAEQNLSYVWKFGVNNRDNSSNLYHFHVPVTVLVTDARDLVKLYDELNALANGAEDVDEENRLKYTEASIVALRPVLEQIPQDLLYGSKYYTQTEVNSYYSMLLDAKNALEPVADYTEFNKTYEEALSKTNDNDTYEPDAFASFQATINYIYDSLDKRLGETQQSVVDAETQKLADLMVVLEQYAYCDYSQLDYLIDYAEKKLPEDNSEGKFREDIYAAVMESLAKAKAVERNMIKGVDGENQKIIDAAAEELLYAIYYDYYNESAQDVIKTDNQNGENKIYLDEVFEKFKQDYENATDKLEEDVKNEDVSNLDAFKDATIGLSNAYTSLEEGKFVDLTDIKNAIEEGKNIENEGYTNSSWDALQNAIKDAEDLALTNPVQGVDGVGTKEVEEKKDAVLDAIENLEKKADYSDFDKALEEAEKYSNTDNKYTNSSWNDLENALKEAEQLNKDMASTTENQSKIDEITEDVYSAITNLKERANYSLLNEEILKAEEILADDSVVYTDSSKKALKEALDIAKALDEDLSVDNQVMINNVLTELVAAREGMKVKADYSALDEAIEKAKEALNRTDIKYTANTEQILRDALTGAGDVTRDLSTDDQYIIDGAVDSLENATENLIEAADTTAYEDAVKDAEEIISEGNSQGRYDEEDWNAFVDSVTDAKDTVGSDIGNIPKTEQDNIDSATEIIKNATEEIYNKRYIFVEFRDEFNGLYKSYRVQYNESLTFENLTEIPQIPEADEFKKYVGWFYNDGSKMDLTDAITKDVAVYCIEEEIKLVTKTESGAEIDTEKSFFKGLKHGTTVETLKNSLDNNLDYVVVKDINENVVDNSVSIATGMTIELVSRENNAVVTEKVTIVVRGDVNGDGLVNDEDFEKSRGMCLKTTEYTTEEAVFFAANDTNNDGVLDVIDYFNVSNLRFGN